RAVKLTMTSEDVLHSYFIPAFRSKMDVVPGRYTTTWFKPTQTGEFHLFCAEYCGTQHSGMIGKVTVLEQDDYQAWLTAGGGLTYGMTPAKSGEKLATTLGCAACHKPDGGGRGPSWNGIFGTPQKLTDGSSVVADEAFIRESILQPRAKVLAGYSTLMNTYQGQVSEEQILDLIAYIKSLSKADATQGEPVSAAATPEPAAVEPATQPAVKPAAKPAGQ
ncbi:MAG: c-type cytochrome, partial [Acidobacteria bacterium]|nr:c-type cytochrome [Acidobacteriota bacterium]